MIIEKMDLPFWSLVEQVITESGNATEVDLSPLAQQLIEITRKVHAKSHILVDVKPDNFMFAKQTKTSQTLPERLRHVDLGLWKMIRKEDFGEVSSLTGNGMYCSLKMQRMQHPTRGDDLQMIVLVIAEMAIRINAKLRGESKKYERTPIPSYLPWSQCKSEQEVFECKEQNLTDRKSEFYQRMPPGCATAIQHSWKKMSWAAKNFKDKLQIVAVEVF